MWKPVNDHTLKVLSGLMLMALVVGLSALSVKSQEASLPPGKGLEKVEKACLVCHEADIIREQRLDRGRWEKDVDKMMRWGAPVASNEDRQEIVNYLSVQFGPPTKQEATRALTLPAGKGVDKVEKACLVCHEVDIITEQRLDRNRWEKDVDKMMRWGAPVAPGDRQDIIDYLSTHFGTTQ